MKFNFETFCKNCDGLSSGKIIAEIQSKLIELEGRRKANQKKAPFPDRNLDRQYESDITKLETLKQFINGDTSGEKNLTESEKNMFQALVDNMEKA